MYHLKWYTEWYALAYETESLAPHAGVDRLDDGRGRSDVGALGVVDLEVEDPADDDHAQDDRRGQRTLEHEFDHRHEQSPPLWPHPSVIVLSKTGLPIERSVVVDLKSQSLLERAVARTLGRRYIVRRQVSEGGQNRDRSSIS